MKRIIRILAAACAAVTLTCCAAPGPSSSAPGGAPAGEPAMGRYLEQELSLPEEALALLSLDSAREEMSGVFLCGPADAQSSEELELKTGTFRDGAWALETPAWGPALLESEWNLDSVRFGPDGTVWALLNDYAESAPVPHVLRQSGEGFEEVPLEEAMSYPRGFAVAGDGSFLLSGGGKTVLYGPDGAVRASIPGYTHDVAASGSTAAVAGSSDGTLTFYQTSDGSQTGSVPLPEPRQYELCLFPGGDGAFYAVSDRGLHRAAPGDEEMSLVLDGDRCRLASAALSVERAAQDSGGAFYVAAQNSAEGSTLLMRYAWSDSTPAAPAKTLRVETLYERTTARQAAVALQLEDPDVAVAMTPRLSGENKAMTVRDAVRAVNTELLAGNGADVYLLDDMPVDSYLEKGVLMDLGEMAQPHLSAGEWLENVVQGLRRDGKLCAIPARFGLPVLWTAGDTASEARDLETLTAWAAEHPSPPLFQAMHAQNLLETFYPVCAPAWRDEKGAIDEAAFAAFLTRVGRLSATAPEASYAERGSGMDGSMEIPGFLLGRNQAVPQETSSPRMVLVAQNALQGEDRQGTPKIRSLPGDAQRVYVPRVIAGVNAKTSLPQEAKRFVELMLSEEVQTVDGVNYEGLPIHRAVLERQLDRMKGSGEEDAVFHGGTVAYGVDFTDEPVVLTLDTPLDPQIKEAFLALCGEAATPSLPDPVLMEMIVDETAGYFSGELTAEQAASAVAARTQAYLTE